MSYYMSTTTSTSSQTVNSGYSTMYQAQKRPRVPDEHTTKLESTSEENTSSPSKKTRRINNTISYDTAISNGSSNTNNSTTYPSMSLSLQRDPSWNTMLGEVDSFGGLGPMPMRSMSAVLEKRFSIGSLLPSNITQTNNTNTIPQLSTRFDTSHTNVSNRHTNTYNVDSNTGTTQLPYTNGSGGNQKYMDTESGEYMYPENVKAMTFEDKKLLVQKITFLPSQYLRGLLDVISKYQPDTVRQIGDDGYAFDIAQMKENTVWAISDYVKDSMIELDGYIKSISTNNIAPNSIQNQDHTNPLNRLPYHTNPSQLSTDLSSLSALNTPKITAISNNENQGKFMEQVKLYSEPKITKSKVRPSKKHECPTCHKQFRGRSELQNHIRTHTGEKPLKCKYAGCTKRYAHSSNLRAHERTHEGVKPYACHYDGCGKTFAHSVSLKEHIWMHAGIQPYECTFEGCDKKFTQVSNFARHKKTHEKDEQHLMHSGRN